MRRISVACVVVLLVCVGTWLVATSGKREPVYQGRSLSSWMHAWPTSWVEVGKPGKTAEDQKLAIEAIDHIGTNAIPMFLEWLQAKDSPMKAKAIAFLRIHSSIPYQPLSAPEKRMLALQGLRVLGPKARVASKELIRIANANDAQTERQIRDIVNQIVIRDSVDAQVNTINPR